MANYRISPNAKDDLERIWRYGVDRWGMEAADAYHATFFFPWPRLAICSRATCREPFCGHFLDAATARSMTGVFAASLIPYGFSTPGKACAARSKL